MRSSVESASFAAAFGHRLADDTIVQLPIADEADPGKPVATELKRKLN